MYASTAVIVVLISTLLAAGEGHDRKWFLRGRLKNGGFLGHLGSSSKLKGSNDAEHWFEQKLNHFEPADDRKWSQRYYVNADNYREGRSGPSDARLPLQFGALVGSAGCG